MSNNMFKELQKFKTGSAVDVPVTLLGSNQKIIMKIDEYTAGVGDLVELYVRHSKKSLGGEGMYTTTISQIT